MRFRYPAILRVMMLLSPSSEILLFKTKSAVELRRYAALLKRYFRFSRSPLTPPVVFDDFAVYARQIEELRSSFPLDSIAGDGSDLLRMRNLLHWIHGRIRWDGSKENPSDSTLGERWINLRT